MKSMNEVAVTIIDPLRDHRWDAFVQDHAFGWLCHLSGWKKVMERSFPHLRGHYFALVEDGKIRAALPVYEVDSWLTGKRLVSLPFATLCDPLVSTAEDLQKLIDAVIDFSRERAVPTVEIRTLLSASYVRDDRLASRSFFSHHYIPLTEPLDQLKKKFHRSCVRQRITRALNSGIEISNGASEQDLAAFYRLYLSNRKSLGLPPQPYAFIRDLWEEFGPSGKVVLLMARKQKHLVGGLILFKFRDRVSAEYAVWDDAFQHMSPIHGLFWEAIQSASAEGYRIFDFGRTSPDNQSLMDFKNRWGTIVVDIHQFFYPRERYQTVQARYTPLTRALVRGVCKASPLPLYELLGQLFYRHLS